MTEQNPLCNFGRWHYGEHSLEIILNLDQWFRRCWLNFFLEKSIFSSGGHFVWQSKTVCAMLVEGRMGKIHVKLFKIWTSGSEGDVF